MSQSPGHDPSGTPGIEPSDQGAESPNPSPRGAKSDDDPRRRPRGESIRSWEEEDLASDLAHTLKNPLQGVLGYADLLRARRFGELDPRAEAAVDKIVEHAVRMIGQVDASVEMLTLAMAAQPASSGPGVLPEEPARIAVERLAEEAMARGVRIENALPSDLPRIAGAPGPLAALFFALYRWALDLRAGDGGTRALRLRAESADEEVRFYVEAGGREGADRPHEGDQAGGGDQPTGAGDRLRAGDHGGARGRAGTGDRPDAGATESEGGAREVAEDISTHREPPQGTGTKTLEGAVIRTLAAMVGGRVEAPPATGAPPDLPAVRLPSARSRSAPPM